MSKTLDRIRSLGVDVHLTRDGRIRLTGLARVSRFESARAVALARDNRDSLIAELSGQEIPQKPIPAPTDTEAAEIESWPVETQALWVRVLEHFEHKGYSAHEAESLSWATVRELQKRHGGRGLCLVSDLDPQLGRAVGLALEVFPGSEVISATG